MSQTTKAFLAIVMAMAGAGATSPASATLYGVIPSTGDSQFVTVDADTGAATLVGGVGFPAIVGLALRSDEALFGSSGQLVPVDLGRIVTIDKGSGAGSEVGPPESAARGPVRDLAFDPANELFGLCNNYTISEDIADSLCIIDQQTGVSVLQARLMYPGTATLRGLEGIAFDSAGTLYGAAGSSYTGGASLFTIDLFSGAATLVGLIRDGLGAQLAAGVTALTFADDVLYGATDDARLVRIDPATAVYDVVGSTGLAGNVHGLAFRVDPPTPTPTLGPPTPLPTATAGPCRDSSPPNPCVPGGGAQRTDCQMEWLVDGQLDIRRGLPLNKIACYEGDPACDADPDLDNRSCAFRANLCINNADSRLPSCSPLDIATFEVRRPNPAAPPDAADQANATALENAAANLGVTVVRRGQVVDLGTSNNAPERCSGPLELRVPVKVKRSGALAPGRKRIRVRGVSSVQVIDSDALVLRCLPSTCGNSIVEPHEQCDDGNRLGGDTCDPGCQVELTTPTHTATATATATFTPSATPTRTPTSTNTPSGPTNTPTETGTPTESPTPGPPTNTPTSTPTPSGICGDGLISGGETCASCPGDCVVAPCTTVTPAPTITFRVNWAPPLGADASSITVLMAYRSNLVSLPGSGSAASSAITNRPSNSIVVVNDLDYAVRVVVTRSGAIAPGRLFHANFNRCNGAVLPTVADFACTVEGCASSNGDVPGCTCEVVTP